MAGRPCLYRASLQRWAHLFLYAHSAYAVDPNRWSGPGHPTIAHQLPEPDLGRLSQLPGTKRRRAHALDRHAGSTLDIALRSMLCGHELCPYSGELLRLVFVDEGSTNS